MDDSGHRENGRHKPDMYKAAAQNQWLMQHQPSMKQIMSIMAERDAAIQERNMAISERNKALEERNLALLERDTAIRQRNEAIAEREHALAALHYRENHIDGDCPNNGGSSGSCPPEVKQEHDHPHQLMQHHDHHQLDFSSKISYEPVLLSDSTQEPSIPVTDNSKQTRKPKRAKETKAAAVSANKKATTNKRKVKTEDGEQDINNNVSALKSHWKGQDLGLNQVAFDDSTMPPPVCSCTGVYRQCYKWGNGGWQSACCTTTMSMYPLPAVLGKKHARIGGRKMSGSAFSKLLSRLSAEGQDLTNPVDLKEHWAKHGTNRYITIK